MGNEKIENSLEKVKKQHKRLKKDKFTGEAVFTVRLIYNQGGIRNEEVVLTQKV